MRTKNLNPISPYKGPKKRGLVISYVGPSVLVILNLKVEHSERS